MTKSIIVSSIVLFTLLIGLSCGSYQEEAKRYQIEEKYFAAEKQLKEFSVKPELRSAEDYSLLIQGYLDVYTKFQELYPDFEQKDSLIKAEKEAAIIAAQALTKASRFYVSAENLDSAEVLLNIIYQGDNFSPVQKNDCLMLLGKLAERQGRWLDAEGHYLMLLERINPPVDKRGFPIIDVLQLPKEIVTQYISSGNREMAIEKIEWAISYYKSLLEGQQQSPLTLSATRYLAELYNAKGEYQKSVDLLSTVVDSSGEIANSARALIADLYLIRLNREKEAVAIYRSIIDNPNDSLLAPSAFMKLATVAFAAKKYSDGRFLLEQLKSKFPRNRAAVIKAQAMIASSFEKEELWDRALQEYQFIVTEFPQSKEAFDALSYLPVFYKKIDQPEKSEEWKEKAITRFKQLEQTYSGKRLGLAAAGYLNSIYLKNKMFDEALDGMQAMRRTYPKSVQAGQALLRIGAIYDKEKDNQEKAIEAYQEFVKLYPNSRVKSKVEEEIKKLEK